MTRILAVLLGLIAAGPAAASDLALRGAYEPALAAQGTGFDWSGGHIGVHAGGATGGRFDTNTAIFGAVAPFSTVISSPSGILGGVQAGYDFRLGTAVIGAGIDFSAASISREVPTALAVNVSGSLNWTGSLRARLGFAATPHVLAYVTGGFAMGEAQVRIPLTGFVTGRTHYGWTFGGGAEFALAPNLTGFAEYRYLMLARQAYDPILPGLRVGYEGHTVRLGLNYRPGLIEPVSQPIIARN